MKKLVLIVALIFMSAISYLNAQVIEDFESIPLNVMLGGAEDLSTMTVVANPDPTGINTSAYVVEFVRDMNGVPWGGFWSALPVPVDLTVNKYVHVKVWKPRISPIKFKVEGGGSANLEIFSMTDQTLVGQWEDIVFDFSEKTGTWNVVALMPDFEDPLTLTEDITIYFDDIMVNNDPTPGSEADYVIEDCGHIPLNLMLGGADDNSTLSWIQNPDASGINTSGRVIEFFRDMNGVPWGGFWSTLPMPVDVTTNKYVHVKVWKPRISPIKFKLEKPGENHEVFSMTAQTLTDQWQDIVFDFSEYTGEWPTIAFMPDFEDPLTLTEDITIYFDDIRVTDSPIPMASADVTFNVNMSYWTLMDKFDPAADFVDVAGNFNNWDGVNHHLTTLDDSIYSITLNQIVVGTVLEFKFRINGSWADTTCEFPFGGPSRTYTVLEGTNVYDCWYNNETMTLADVTFNVNMSYWTLMDKFDPAADFVDIAGNFNGFDGINHHLTTLDDSIYSITVNQLVVGTLLEFKFRINGSWDDATCEFPSNGPNRTYTVVEGTNVYDAWYNNEVTGIGENSLTGKVQMYPNPTTGDLIIQTSTEISEVIISTLQGQQVANYNQFGMGRTTISITDLNDGIYFVTFYGKNGDQLTQKLIKK